MTIYEIDAEIQNCIDTETGEVDIERLNALQMERDKKIENLALWDMDLSGDADKLTAEIKRLQDKKTAIQNKRDRLREYLVTVLNGEKFKTPLVSVRCGKSDTVVVDNVDALPAEFVTEVTEKKVDKTALKKAFKEWDSIVGAHIEHNEYVVIK